MNVSPPPSGSYVGQVSGTDERRVAWFEEYRAGLSKRQVRELRGKRTDRVGTKAPPPSSASRASTPWCQHHNDGVTPIQTGQSRRPPDGSQPAKG
jgi:hypothetical protein